MPTSLNPPGPPPGPIPDRARRIPDSLLRPETKDTDDGPKGILKQPKQEGDDSDDLLSSSGSDSENSSDEEKQETEETTRVKKSVRFASEEEEPSKPLEQPGNANETGTQLVQIQSALPPPPNLPPPLPFPPSMPFHPMGMFHPRPPGVIPNPPVMPVHPRPPPVSQCYKMYTLVLSLLSLWLSVWQFLLIKHEYFKSCPHCWLNENFTTIVWPNK